MEFGPNRGGIWAAGLDYTVIDVILLSSEQKERLPQGFLRLLPVVLVLGRESAFFFRNDHHFEPFSDGPPLGSWGRLRWLISGGAAAEFLLAAPDHLGWPRRTISVRLCRQDAGPGTETFDRRCGYYEWGRLVRFPSPTATLTVAWQIFPNPTDSAAVLQSVLEQPFSKNAQSQNTPKLSSNPPMLASSERIPCRLHVA